MDLMSVKEQFMAPADPEMQDAPVARQEDTAGPEDANVPMVLGFEAANGSNGNDRRIVETAYRRGCERGENLGAIIRNLIADTPLDRC
ncbi:MAG: hypothetical protein M3436_18615 [Pseudomonadota bacterium]|nr:hypothetical protein [Pseudomonadota bacterium]